jgi:hypothetical protein
MPDVSPTLKEVNGRLFDKAYSDDPTIACQAIGKLVSTLKESARQLQTDEHDQILNRALLGSNRAWEPGKAMQTVRAVLTNELARFAFDPQFTALDTNSFIGGR